MKYKTLLLILIGLSFLTCKSDAKKQNPPATISDVSKNIKKSTSSEKNWEDITLRAAVLKDNEWMFIHPDGSFDALAGFTYADNYSNGLACVSSNGTRAGNATYGATYFFIDKAGKKSDFFFDEPVRFDEERAIVPKNRKKAIINRKGDFIAEGFDAILPYENGLATAQIGDTLGFLDKEGEWSLQFPNTLLIEPFSHGLARIKKDGKTGYMNKKGIWVVEPIWEKGFTFSGGLAGVKKGDLYGYIDTTGELVVPLQFKDFGACKEGMCHVLKDEKWGFVDTNGNLVIDYQFKKVSFFSEGLAAVQMEDNKIGFIDRAGKMRIEPQFDSVIDFKNGYCIVEKNKKLGFINKQGELITGLEFDRANNFVDINASNKLMRK